MLYIFSPSNILFFIYRLRRTALLNSLALVFYMERARWKKFLFCPSTLDFLCRLSEWISPWLIISCFTSYPSTHPPQTQIPIVKEKSGVNSCPALGHRQLPVLPESPWRIARTRRESHRPGLESSVNSWRLVIFFSDSLCICQTKVIKSVMCGCRDIKLRWWSYS